MNTNNEAKIICSNFCKSSGLTKIGSRNAVQLGDKVYGFTTQDIRQIDYRQFYEDYEGLIVYNQMQESFVIVDKKNLNITSRATRVSPNGLKAFQAYSK